MLVGKICWYWNVQGRTWWSTEHF